MTELYHGIYLALGSGMVAAGNARYEAAQLSLVAKQDAALGIKPIEAVKINGAFKAANGFEMHHALRKYTIVVVFALGNKGAQVAPKG